jgi:hypothetical protein
MSSFEGSAGAPKRPPHITVNSGSGGDLIDNMRSASSASTVPGTPGATRNLLPAASRPGTARSISQKSLYATPEIAASAEMLLPPAKARGPRPYSDFDNSSRNPSGMSSRRTSFDSESASRDSRYSPFASPFDDSRAPSRAGSDDDNVNTQTVSEKYNIMPSAGLLLFPEDVEKDDWLHNPGPNDNDREKCDIFTKRGMTNVGGLGFVTIGLLVLFIAYPILYVCICL